MLVPGDFLNRHVRIGVQQTLGLEVDPVDRIHLAGQKRVHPGGVVIDRDVFDFVKETRTVAFVMVWIASRDHAHTGIKALHLIQASANPVCNRFFDLASRIHQDMIIR